LELTPTLTAGTWEEVSSQWPLFIVAGLDYAKIETNKREYTYRPVVRRIC